MRNWQKRRSLGRALGLAASLALLVPITGLADNDADPSQRHRRRPRPFHGGPFVTIQQQLDAISAQLENLYVPFKVEIPGGLCNSETQGSANPEIIIDSDGMEPFTLNSVLIKRGFQNPVDFLFLSVNGVTIDGTFFETRTGSLFDPLFGEFQVEQAADIMGMPVRRGGAAQLFEEPLPGGNVPHEIVALGDGPEDVRFLLFCRSDEQDLEIETVLVAGWKKPGDTISVTYVPGD